MSYQISWIPGAIFYHIYPLGLCGAPPENDFVSSPVNRLKELNDWIGHIKGLGCNALYLGPVFESDYHGYDTADYCKVDRRLGTNQTLTDLSRNLHQQGIKLVLDTVFNHVGRNFFAFKDLQVNGEKSVYIDWFTGVDFSRQSTYGDNFVYDGWYDAYNLVKLNLKNPEVKNYLFAVVEQWMAEFDIDGLRLDVAEIMDKDFLAELSAFCHAKRDDFWLMGEVINGDYNEWANDNMLDSTTNYEAYKGLYSSHNDHNYFEIAYTLKRQFGNDGYYKSLLLYNFVDNHDVTRAASILNNKADLFTLYVLLYTMPGIPSVYYGSEWGQTGVKGAHEDTLLRPAIENIPDLTDSQLCRFIIKLAQIRQAYVSIKTGTYKELYVTHHQFTYCRETGAELIIVGLNSAPEPVTLNLLMNQHQDTALYDLLDTSYQVSIKQQGLILDLPGKGIRILAIQVPGVDNNGQNNLS